MQRRISTRQLEVVHAQTAVLGELSANVSAVRAFWQTQQKAQELPPLPISRPRIRLKSSIKEVRLRKVERTRRDAEWRSRHVLPRPASHAALTAAAQTAAAWIPGIADLDDHLLSRILHAAAAPIRAGVGGAAVAVRQWTHFALVCTSFRRIMLAEPVTVAVGLDRWPAVRDWLAVTQVPLAALRLTAADGRAAQQLGQLLCCPHFAGVSGRHLTCTEVAFGFRFAAPQGAWPALQSLGDLIGLPRLPAALPLTLTRLSLWAPGSPHPQRAPPPLGPALRGLVRLRCLWLGGWQLGHADLPPALQLLKLQACVTTEDVATWPPPLRRLLEVGVAPRGNTPADPFLPVGRPATPRQTHLVVYDPAADRRLLSAFLRPPLRRWPLLGGGR